MTERAFTIPFEARPYIRMVQGSWFTNPRVQEYLAWKARVASHVEGLNLGHLLEGPLRLEVVFRGSTAWHIRDLDNLVKGLSDALNPRENPKAGSVQAVMWVDDRQVKDVAAAACFDTEHRIDVTVTSLFEETPFSALGVYECRGQVKPRRILLSNSAVAIPARAIMPDILQGGQALQACHRKMAVLLNPQEGAYLAFRTPEHALLYLLAQQAGARAVRRTEALFTEGDFAAEDCISDRVAPTIASLAPSFPHYLARCRAIKPSVVDSATAYTYHIGTEWAPVRPIIRRRLLTVPVDDLHASLTLTGTLPMRKAKKPKKKKP